MSKVKIVHRGHLTNQRGGVSALCYSKPRAINLALASWTNRDEAVTCEKCQQKMRERESVRCESAQDKI